MKLHSPNFDKVLRRSVKTTIRGSRELKREYRRNRLSVWRRKMPGWIARPLFSSFLGLVVWTAAGTTRHADTGLAVITLWSVGLWAGLAANAQRAIFRALDLPALALLPIAEPDVFRWEAEKFFWKFGVPCAFDFLAGFAGLGLALGFGVWQWIAAMVAAALSWTMVLAAAALGAARFPQFPYPMVSGSLFVLGFTLVVTRSLVGHAALIFLDGIAGGLNLLVPLGWGPSLLSLVVIKRMWVAAGLVIPIGLVITTTKDSLRRLRRRLTFAEAPARETSDQIPSEDPANAPAATGPETAAPFRVGPTAIEEIVESRRFMVQPDWQNLGWAESMLWRWMDRRERSLADFAFPRGILITSPWTRIFRNLTLTVLIGFAVRSLNLALAYWVFGIGLFITVGRSLLMLLENGAGFRPLSSSGVRVPIYAAYPVGFREMSRMLFKCAAVQLPMLLPFLAACGALLGYISGGSIITGAIVGAKAAVLILAGRFIVIALAFSSGTNDSTKLRPRTAALFLAFIVFGLGFLGLGLVGLFVPDRLASWACWLLALGDAYLLFRIYGWFYHANRFDLMTMVVR